MKNERLRSIFGTRSVDTRVMVLMLAELLGEDRLNKVLDMVEPASTPMQKVVAGQPLIVWSGMSDEQLKTVGLDEAQIKEVRVAQGDPSVEETSSVPSEESASDESKSSKSSSRTK